MPAMAMGGVPPAGPAGMMQQQHHQYAHAPAYAGSPAPVAMPPAMGPYAMPMPAPVGLDFDDRPPKSNAGLVIVIVVALLILFSAGLGGFYLLLSDRGGSGSASGDKASAATSDKGGVQTVSASRGVLTIQAVPADAQVTVDGKAVSGPSPFVDTLDLGKHKVAVTHPSYIGFEKEVEVTDSGLTLPVTLAHRAVTLNVETDPSGGTVSLVVDGAVVGTAASGGSIPVTRDPAKKYEVQAALQGYVTQRNALSFTGEPSQPVRISMMRDTIADAGTPPPVADPPPSTTTNPTPSKPTNAGGSSSKPKSSGGGTKKPVAKTATLKIGTNMGVVSAKAYVDGTFVGNTPQTDVKVTPGRHTVKWQWDNGKKVTQSVNIADGQTKVVKAG